MINYLSWNKSHFVVWIYEKANVWRKKKNDFGAKKHFEIITKCLNGDVRERETYFFLFKLLFAYYNNIIKDQNVRYFYFIYFLSFSLDFVSFIFFVSDLPVFIPPLIIFGLIMMNYGPSWISVGLAHNQGSCYYFLSSLFAVCWRDWLNKERELSFCWNKKMERKKGENKI